MKEFYAFEDSIKSAIEDADKSCDDDTLAWLQSCLTTIQEKCNDAKAMMDAGKKKVVLFLIKCIIFIAYKR